MILILTASDLFAEEIIHHRLHVSLDTAHASISVSDKVQLPAGTDKAEFILNSDLTVTTNAAELILLGESAAGRLRHYRIVGLAADGKVQLDYAGRINAGERTSSPFDMPEAVLNTEYVYLDGASNWVPAFDNHPLYTFSLDVAAPQNWQVISQGKRSDITDNGRSGYRFDMPQPQDDIFLLAGPYQRFTRNHEGTEVVVYLFDDDSALAEQYMQASAGYLSLYSDWIGRYPYATFAVVENRWQTGYGMPSFTLLGSTVIRLPFILSTSLPHEILHNWLGNGVYVDPSQGNWSEGLTAYMSDHFSSEQQGRGSEYRRKALERYANFAAEQGDFSLSDFRSRHDEASQAIGYSKSLMLFHMLRKLSGDAVFNSNIRKLWQRYQFSYADFPDVIRQLYPTDGNNSDEGSRLFIEQWLRRTGAPEISLDDVSINQRDGDYLLSLSISQQQPGPAYQLQIPLEITFQDNTRFRRESLLLTSKSNRFTLKLDNRPQSVTLDPDYDVFRLLHANERPASLGRLFGAKKQWLVLPSHANAEQLSAWRQLAASWSSQYSNIELVYDRELTTIPEGSAVWLLGWTNELLKSHQHSFSSSSQNISGSTVTIDGQRLAADKHAVVLLDADNTSPPLGFIGADDPAVIAALARKLPHYSSYGMLVFELPEVNNIIKQHLPVLRSPMVWQFDN